MINNNNNKEEIDLEKLTYDEYSELVRKDFESYRNSLAKDLIPILCTKIKQENPEMSPAGIRIKIIKDCSRIWPERTIRNNWPDFVKDKISREAID